MAGNTELLTAAYSQGVKDAEAFIESKVRAGEDIPTPCWSDRAKSIEEEYYRKGYTTRYKEISGVTINAYTPLSRKNHTLDTSNGGRRRLNSLERMIKDKGSDFLDKFGDRFYNEAKNLAERVLRDLANKNVNVPDYEEYFRADRFLDMLIMVAQANMNYHTFTAKAIRFFGVCAENNTAGATPAEYDQEKHRFHLYHAANAEIYTILFNALVEFKSMHLGGVFNPESIHKAESEIFHKKLNMTARDPYAQRRV